MGKSAEDIKDITCRTHEACIRIIDKQFKPMDNFADRDHCVQVNPPPLSPTPNKLTHPAPSQYMASVMLVFGRLSASDYTDGSEAATSPLVESLRQRITCVEDPLFTQAYHEASLRSIPNALLVTLHDGTLLEEVVVQAPLGHRSRREEAKPEIRRKYRRHLGKHFGKGRVDELVRLGEDGCASELEGMDVDRYVDLYVKEEMEW